MYNKTGNVRIT